jgi:uncharacterized protein YbaR (Trm112 family)/ubiquinone/menaquinone biosynthesis C-methylase UbiE
MKRRLLDFLVCPACQVPFNLTVISEDEGEIVTGELKCTKCKALFPVRQSIPRILPLGLSIESQDTADAFGWQWEKFVHITDVEINRDQFLDWIYPVTAGTIKDSIVLDAGCGMGRFSRVASALGAKEVISVDISSSVNAANKNVAEFANIHVVQADLCWLPLRKYPPLSEHVGLDFIFSIGVVHHMDNPEKGFHALARHLKEGGTISVWVYGFENNEWLVKYINPLRISVSSKLPRTILYSLSFLITLFLQPLLKIIYLPANQMNRAASFKNHLPYNGYFSWLSRFNFEHNHHVIFDHLVAPTAYYLKREEFESWFDKDEFEDVTITWRNENSWRGCGRRKRAEK